MSDSDDNAFASADEGDDNGAQQKQQPRKGSAKASSKSEQPEGATKDVKKVDKDTPVQHEKCLKGKRKQKQKVNKAPPREKNISASRLEEMKESKRQEEEEENIGKKKDGAAAKTDDSNLSGSQISGKATAQKDTKGDVKSDTSRDSLTDAGGTDKLKQAESSSTAEKTPAKVRTSSSEVKSPEGQSIAPSERDHHTQEQEAVLHKLQESTAPSSGSGWGWSSWGSSLLSAASNSVQTFTSQVGDGLNTIMDTVESSLGVPDPKTLAEEDRVKEEEPVMDEPETQTVTHQPDESAPTSTQAESGDERSRSERVEDTQQVAADSESSASSWFSSWGVGDIAKKMQDTTKNLAAKGQTLMTEGFDAVEHFAAGGIDVLETIGKKTYNTIAEHDPALKRTRQFLSSRSGSDKPNLSATLKEAREQAEKRQQQEEATQEALKADFGALFDDYQGIAHLEALEMLSNQSEKKVHSLLNSLAKEDLETIKPQLLDIKAAFQLDDEAEDETGDQDFTSLVQQHLSELKLGTAPDKLNTVHQMVQAWIQDFDSETSEAHKLTKKETHEKSIQALAELTAKGVEQFHKAGELVLMDKDQDKDCTERAHSLARLTGVLCHEIGNLSNKFVACLNKLTEEDKSENATSMITNIYLEASNSSTYIQDAFLLLLPVLQHAALEQAILARTS